MSWYILVVLQVGALSGGGTTAANWAPIGEFRGQQACIQAARQLRDEQEKVSANIMPKRFACLPKEAA